MATFLLELVSPERLQLSRQVEMATLPGVEGDMGVLPGHSPMIVALRGGVIRVREDGAESEVLFVPGGFAEVTPERCTVLADEATPVGVLSRAEAERRLAAAEAAPADADETPDRRDSRMARIAAMVAMRDAAEAS